MRENQLSSESSSKRSSYQSPSGMQRAMASASAKATVPASTITPFSCASSTAAVTPSASTRLRYASRSWLPSCSSDTSATVTRTEYAPGGTSMTTPLSPRFTNGSLASTFPLGTLRVPRSWTVRVRSFPASVIRPSYSPCIVAIRQLCAT
jgi:hypothetical protein